MSALEQLAGRWKSGNGIEVERIHITRSEFAALKAEDGELRAEVDEYDKLRERMADILTHTVNALRGNPKTDFAWSWHDLPEIALSTITERDQLRAELERVRSCMKTTFWVSAYDDSGYGDDRSKEFSDDGEALSYAKSLGDRFMPSVSKRMSFALNASELIYSRDAPSQLKQPPIEPIPGTAAALAKLTIRGG